MEYANLQTSQHHQLQEQVNNNINGVPSTSLPIIAPTTLVSTSCNWINPTLVLNDGTDVYQSTEIIPNSWLWRYSPTTTFTSRLEYFNYLDHHHHLHDARSRAFTQRPSATTEDLPASLNPNLIKEEKPSAPSMMNASFGHVFPSTTTTSSTSTRSPTALSPIMFPSLMLSSGDFNNNKYNSVQALDLLSSSPSTDAAKYCNNSDGGSQISYSPSSQQYDSNIDKSMIRRSLYGEQPMSHVQGHDHGHHDHHDMMQESRSTPSNISNSIMRPAFFNEVTRTKRPSSFSSIHQQKESHAEANNKKSKPILRSSNPPLKVRKEKLGDRISALHRLVAPFGKTDTASVLTEAIGYILFLHDQVQTLSMPYMKSMQSKSSRKMPQVHGFSKELEETEMKMDLRSRGLCLVPQSCASYINGLD